jgi:uncharacterized protein YbcI
MTTAHADREPGASMRTALANATVAVKKRCHGEGSTGDKRWILDDDVSVAMEHRLTRNEETVPETGRDGVARTYRPAFQKSVSEATMAAVHEITGSRVVTYHSQIIFDPERTLEIFVLEPQP